MKFKKLAVSTLAMALMVAVLAVPSSAMSVDLRKGVPSAVAESGSWYHYAKGELTTYSTSSHGVNLYIDSHESGYGWSNQAHCFAEPGYAETSYQCGDGSKDYWRIVLNSFYPGGTDCVAHGYLDMWD